jgi:hypothetical protein
VQPRSTLNDAIGATHHLVQGAEAETSHDLAQLFGHVEEEANDVLGLAAELLAQLGVLCGNADRARVEVALSHHDAARCDERGGGEAELLGAEERAKRDVAAGGELTVHLKARATAQAVHDEHLVRLGQAELPGNASVVDRRERRSAGSARIAADEDQIGVRLDDAGGDGADSCFRDELHADPRVGVDVLQVEDELREILDGVDVVVGRRRDERDARRRVANRGDDLVDLVAR